MCIPNVNYSRLETHGLYLLSWAGYIKMRFGGIKQQKKCSNAFLILDVTSLEHQRLVRISINRNSTPNSTTELDVFNSNSYSIWFDEYTYHDSGHCAVPGLLL